jgi:hypothetical protein
MAKRLAAACGARERSKTSSFRVDTSCVKEAAAVLGSPRVDGPEGAARRRYNLNRVMVHSILVWRAAGAAEAAEASQVVWLWRRSKLQSSCRIPAVVGLQLLPATPARVLTRPGAGPQSQASRRRAAALLHAGDARPAATRTSRRHERRVAQPRHRASERWSPCDRVRACCRTR